jgi:hypothetical protein
MKSVPANLPVVKSVAAVLFVIFLLAPALAPAQEGSDKKPSAAGILERAIGESGVGAVAILEIAEDLYFSIETGLLTEKREQYPQSYPVMLSYMSFWDYRDVGGIRIPHVFIRNVGVLGPPHGGVVEDVQVNVPLDDSLFVKPR